MKKHLGMAIATLFAMSMLAPALRAQDQGAPPADQSGQEQAPPDQSVENSQAQPAVGHISYIHGNVSIQRGDSGDWIAATLNTPIEAGDRVSTGDDSRAEVQLDYADILRLAPNSTAKITDLTQNHIQVQVGQGLVSYSVLENSQADAEIDTPNSAVHPLRQGNYRIEVDNDSQTQVTVREGQAEVSEPQGSTRVEAGQLITIQGTDNPQYQTNGAAGPDDFDRWNQDRDHTILSASSWGHTDRYYTGSQDLDAYGHWDNVPDYGQVWVPNQDSGWAPYRDGDWQWEPYYGWTWVSYEPWGWAPYHYGRWFVYGDNWAWWPGPVGVYGGWGYRPIWSPAYVSFFGWGDGGGFGFGFGNVGWLPCGPGDFFTPWWGFGVNINFISFGDRDDFGRGFRDGRFGRGVGDRDFGRRVDPLFRGGKGVSNISRFANDARIRNGVTSVRGENFGHGGGRFERGGVGTEQFQKASFMTGRLPAVPNRQSLGRVQDHVSPAIARTGGANNQHFFSQSRASVTSRSFSQEASVQQRAVESFRTGKGGNNSHFSNPTQQQRGNQAVQPNGGVRTNETLRPGIAERGSQPAMQARPGWHSFSEPGNVRMQGQPGLQNRPSIQGPRGNQPPTRFEQQNPQSRPNGNSDAWHRFTPPSGNNNGARQNNSGSRPQMQYQPRMNQPPSRPFQQSSSPQRPNGNWHQFTPPPSQQSRPASRPGNWHAQSAWGNFSRPNNGYGNYSPRPQLSMRQPVANQRSYGNYGGNYGRPSRSYSSPRMSGRFYSAPRGSYGGSGYSPRGSYGGGGSGYTPRGGSYSAPRGSYGGSGYSPRGSYGGGGGGGYAPRGGSYSGGGIRGGGGGGSHGGSSHSGGGSHGGGRPH